MIQFDLVLFSPSDGKNNFLQYDSSAISREYGLSIARTLEGIQRAIASNMELHISELNLVSEQDKARINLWNPKASYARMTCLHYLVEATARIMPHSKAVCSWDGNLTFAQLEATSSLVSQRLIAAGVNTGAYVPFAYEKSLWVVVITLAILKAGGALLPLDPAHPRARNQDIMKSAKAVVVITSDGFAANFEGLPARVMVISGRNISVCSHTPINEMDSPRVTPSDPVFVLFTSGSTGKPKGIVLEHGAICTHALCHGETMGYRGARVLQFAAHTFDVAIMDIFTTLLFGGCICIPSEDDRRSDIVSVINRMGVDYAILTPLFAGLIDPLRVQSLKTLAVGGEALRKDRLDRWANKVNLIQIYGPAEVGICLARSMEAQTPPENVGYPLPNSLCRLVSPENPKQLVPVGAVGELLVAGPSLARGYLNDDEKTGESFIDRPLTEQHSSVGSDRFFKTGDLLRYNSDFLDGSFDFVGRKDGQVKLRGQRLEPTEVEHVLAEIPGVDVAMVVQPGQGCFAGKLVAIVQSSNPLNSITLQRYESVLEVVQNTLSRTTMESRLCKNLPAFMIPAECLTVRRMPLTPSLKIDRKSVTCWLEGLGTRPSQVMTAMEEDLSAEPLGVGEHLAIEVSLIVADVIARDDHSKRRVLERQDYRLHKAGIDSLQLISLSLHLQGKYHAAVDANCLWDSKITIRDLAVMIDPSQSPPVQSSERIGQAVDISQLVATLTQRLLGDLDFDRPNEGCHKRPPVCNVFVTGSTGNLGSAILQDLLARPTIHVFALVKCSSESAGLSRLVNSAVQNGWWRAEFESRVHVWRGDLTRSNFDLDDHQLELLSGGAGAPNDCIHAVVHSGARIHYGADCETLWPVNVHPTVVLLRIAAQSAKLSRFVFVTGGARPMLGSEGSDVAARQGNGYAQTKFISEELVRSCAACEPFAESTELFIVKPGYIVGSVEAGLANNKDFIWRLVAGCVDIGAYNRDEAAHWLYLADIGRVAHSCVLGLFDDANARDSIVDNIEDGLFFSDLWRILREDFGFELEALRYDQWMVRLKAAIMEKREKHVLFPLLHVLEKDGNSIGGSEAPRNLGQARGSRALEAVRSNVKYLIETTFLPDTGRSER